MLFLLTGNDFAAVIRRSNWVGSDLELIQVITCMDNYYSFIINLDLIPWFDLPLSVSQQNSWNYEIPPNENIL
jgi:hypothetical protein